MTPQDRARQFAALHVKGRPLILFNAWDAGSAKAIATRGKRASISQSRATSANLSSESPGVTTSVPRNASTAW